MLFSLVSCDETDKKKNSEYVFIVDGVEYARLPAGTPEPPKKDGYVFDGWYLDDGVWNVPLFNYSFVFKPVEGNDSNYVVSGDNKIEFATSNNVIIVSPGVSGFNGSYIIGDESTFSSYHFDFNAGGVFVGGNAINVTSSDGIVYVYAKFITEAEAAERKEQEAQKDKDYKENDKEKNESPSEE
jgi:hypothetical protein